jgi:hypothetical protein
VFREAGHPPPHKRFARRDENYLVGEPVVGFPVVNWGSMGDMERKVNGKCAYFTYFKVRGSRV